MMVWILLLCGVGAGFAGGVLFSIFMLVPAQLWRWKVPKS